jgi:putative glutamine amidotransferase
MPVYVGITTSYRHEEGLHCLRGYYVDSVKRAGGIPVVIPSVGQELAPACGQNVDAVVLSGGGDMDPYHFREEPRRGLGEVSPDRDLFELALARWALSNDVPMLGVCRGMQVLNVAAGGSLHQDIRSRQLHYQTAPRQYPSHDILITDDTILQSLLGQAKEDRVNSFHHQAVNQPGKGVVVSAVARDGVVEALEFSDKKFAIGVQWHPETLRGHVGEGLFRALVKVSARKRGK